MSQFTRGNVPGFQSQIEGEEAQVWWSGRGGQNLVASQRVVLDGSNTDENNSPTSTLAGGNLLAVDEECGNAYLYDPDANNGRQIVAGVLEHAQDMLCDGVATDRFTQMLVTGLLKTGELSGLDPRARAQLAGRFVFDDGPDAVGVLMHPRGVVRKSDDYTVTAADNGLLFLSSGAVTFTLPAKQNGLAYRFLQTDAATLTVTGSGDIVHKGNGTANSVAFSTVGQQIGSHVLVECMPTPPMTP